MDNNKRNKYKIIRLIIQAFILLLILAVIIFACIKLYPIFNRMQKDEIYLNEVLNKINSYGSISWLILIGMQVLQTILAVVPAGPIVMITGMLYNPFLAVVICLVGQTLGALAVIGLVKLFGYSFLALFIDPEQPKKLKLLDDGPRCGVLIFSYLLIPCLPKDPITFIVPFTKLKIRYFLIIQFFAKIPMTIVTVVLGNSLVTGNYIIAIILGGFSLILAILCFIFNKRIVNFIEKIANKNQENA